MLEGSEWLLFIFDFVEPFLYQKIRKIQFWRFQNFYPPVSLVSLESLLNVLSKS